MEVHGKLVDIHRREIFPATVTVENGIITHIAPNSHRGSGFILPGFVDAHLQIESTLLPPTELARMTLRHGTVAAVSLTQTMAKSVGADGIDYLHRDARKAAIKFFFNAKRLHEVDHSSSTLSEAREKKGRGMKIALCEGSLAKNLNVLLPLLEEAPQQCMFCTDHLFPDSLVLGHLNLLVRRAVQRGVDVFDAISCASKNPVEHYGLDVGLLRRGDPADFIVVEDLSSFRVLETYVNGECLFKNGPLLTHFEVPLLSKTPKVRVLDAYELDVGAIASTFIAFGVEEKDRENAINAILAHNGGLAFSYQGKTDILPLPIAGLMSTLEGEEMARRYGNLDQMAKNFGSKRPLGLYLTESYV